MKKRNKNKKIKKKELEEKGLINIHYEYGKRILSVNETQLLSGVA